MKGFCFCLPASSSYLLEAFTGTTCATCLALGPASCDVADLHISSRVLGVDVLSLCSLCNIVQRCATLCNSCQMNGCVRLHTDISYLLSECVLQLYTQCELLFETCWSKVFARPSQSTWLQASPLTSSGLMFCFLQITEGRLTNSVPDSQVDYPFLEYMYTPKNVPPMQPISRITTCPQTQCTVVSLGCGNFRPLQKRPGMIQVISIAS